MSAKKMSLSEPTLWNDEPASVERRPSTVSEVSALVKNALELRLNNVWIEGEVTNFTAPSSGHWYFSLTDGDSILKAACYKGTNFRIRFKPSDGLLVRCRGRITGYEKRSEYQLIVESLQPVGEGARTLAFEQIKQKLFTEGLFDDSIKRPIPRFPRRVGIVTSPDGAAVHDIMTVLERRARSVNVVIIPATVQGEYSAREIVAGIKMANAFCERCLEGEKIDVLIVGRGGGSIEDLWSFNEEIVARAIRGSEIPVISAVGHEIDYTIADLAADLRAPTPSAAAELVADAEDEIVRVIGRSEADLRKAMRLRMMQMRGRIERADIASASLPINLRLSRSRVGLGRVGNSLFAAERTLLTTLSKKLADADSRRSPSALSGRLARMRGSLAALDQKARLAATAGTETRLRKWQAASTALNAMSPLQVLTRGYSIAQKQTGEIVRSVDQVDSGEALRLRVSDGNLIVEVKEKK